MLGVVLAGGTLVFGGLFFADFKGDAWASVLIEGGAAIALAGLLVALERRMVVQAVEGARDEARAVARAETTRAADDLRGRVERLEDLERSQDEASSRRRGAVSEKIAKVRSGDVRCNTVGALLLEGHRGLFNSRYFRVRASLEPNGPVLYFVPLQDGRNEVPFIWLDFDQPTFSGRTIDAGRIPIEVPDANPTTVLWAGNTPASEVAGELAEVLERTNTPSSGFSLAYALDRLARSLEIMIEARRAPGGSPRRLQGRLELLINEHWVLTDAGLESLDEALVYPLQGGGFTAAGGRIWLRKHLVISDEPVDLDGWSEARKWMEDREGTSIHASPPKPNFPRRPKTAL